MSISTRVLIVEDDADSAEFLRLLLEPEGYVVKTAATAQHARAEVTAANADVILMDLMLPDVEGLDLLREFRTMSPESQVIVVSGHGSISVAVEAMENGALSFIEKPINPSVLMAQLHKAAEKLALTTENRRLRAELDEGAPTPAHRRSTPIRQLYQLIQSVALLSERADTGETAAARDRRRQSLIDQSAKALHQVNCAAIPTELMIGAVGHSAVHSPARERKQGLMDLANNGPCCSTKSET